MIGPHEGRELELMLAGEKPLALFSGLPEEGNREDIFPEQKFLPYVADGTFQRISADIQSSKNKSIIRFVFFVSPEQEWRARAIIWVKQETLTRGRKFDIHDDVFVGRLLGYTEADIEHFIQHQASILKPSQRNQDTNSL